ncbi:hypothetical protein BG006_007341 [Podila minutissima]|uniref:Uncharacterized protein n=1 Tax=Podila minutissima TaxID=64525 RepID=A0A9P5VKQ7_9FUNG|nr:hypothetical protein BG006_007341 [Podila minutissima]
MTRVALFVFMATLALLASSQAQSASKPECAPLHTLYKTSVSTCTDNNNAIPHTDADIRWKKCICLPGFFPLAEASEKCLLKGTQEPPLITPAGLDALCATFPNYTPAASQKPNADLAPALASMSAIAASQPTAPAGGSGGSGSGTSGSSSVQPVALMMVSFVAVVLATAVSF